jgi:YesN/AraC family two-component response regulator
MNISLRPNEKLSVLIADDEVDIRETLVAFLEMMDCFTFIIEAGDGAEAYIKYQNQNFDFVITDLMMPRVRGIELIQNMKRDCSRKKMPLTPTMILSANVTGDEVKKAIPLGVKYVMTKPCTAEQFIDKVSEVIKKEFRSKVKITEDGEEEEDK